MEIVAGEEMSLEKRIAWVDIIKYICILMVMLAHLESNTNLWSVFYSPFALMAFFFVSGYVYRPQHDFKTFFYKKCRQLLVPWLVFSVGNIVLSQIYSFNEHSDIFSELFWNFLQIRGKGDEIWFVAALFVSFIPFYFCINWYESGKKGAAIAAVSGSWVLSFISTLYSRLMPAESLPWDSSALPWHIEYIFQAMFYMVLGYVFKKRMESRFDQFNTVNARIAVWVLYLALGYLRYFNPMQIPLLADIFYEYVLQLLGIAAVVMTAKKIRPNRYISYVGRNTLIYFALHGKAYSAIQILLKRTVGEIYGAILANTAASSVFALAFSLLLSVILMVPAYIINRYFPWIMGRRKPAEIR